MVNPCIGSDPSAYLANNTVLTIWLMAAIEATMDVENQDIDQQKKRKKAEGSKTSLEAEEVTISPPSFTFKCYEPDWGIEHFKSLQVQLLAPDQVKTSRSSPHGSWHIDTSNENADGDRLHMVWHWAGDERKLCNQVFRRIPNTHCWQRIRADYGSGKGSYTFLMPWVDEP